jgi:hypothetical protein
MARRQTQAAKANIVEERTRDDLGLISSFD